MRWLALSLLVAGPALAGECRVPGAHGALGLDVPKGWALSCSRGIPQCKQCDVATVKLTPPSGERVVLYASPRRHTLGQLRSEWAHGEVSEVPGGFVVGRRIALVLAGELEVFARFDTAKEMEAVLRSLRHRR